MDAALRSQRESLDALLSRKRKKKKKEWRESFVFSKNEVFFSEKIKIISKIKGTGGGPPLSATRVCAESDDARSREEAPAAAAAVVTSGAAGASRTAYAATPRSRKGPLTQALFGDGASSSTLLSVPLPPPGSSLGGDSSGVFSAECCGAVTSTSSRSSFFFLTASLTFLTTEKLAS